MAITGGPWKPISVFPVTAPRIFGGFHVCAGAGLKRVDGIRVEASLGADATVELIWDKLPNPLPSGTMKLDLTAISNATSGNAKYNPKWNMGALEADPSGLTMNAETTQTLSWGAGDNDQFKQGVVTLDASIPVAAQFVVMQLVFETSGWTLAQISTWQPSIIFET